MSLSPAATIILNRAAAHPDGRLEFHRKLPTAARHKMIDALLRDGVIAETKGDYRLGDGALLIEDASTGLMLTTLAITDAGFRAIDLEPPGATPETAATDAPTAPHAATDEAVAQEAAAVADALDAATVGVRVVETRQGPVVIYPSELGAGSPPLPRRTALLAAAAAVLAAWDDQDNRDTDIIGALDAPMESLRALLAAVADALDAAPVAPAGPVAGTRTTLRSAVQAAVDAYMRGADVPNYDTDLNAAMTALEMAITPTPIRAAGAARKPREGTKREAVLTLLGRPDGASGTEIMDATGWNSNTTRGFLAGLKKKGTSVVSTKQGGKTIYSVAP